MLQHAHNIVYDALIAGSRWVISEHEVELVAELSLWPWSVPSM